MDIRIVFLFFHERIPYNSIYETPVEVKFLQQYADTGKVLVSATIRTIIMVRIIRLQAVMLIPAVCAAVVFYAGCRFTSGNSDKTTYEAPQADSSSGGITLSIVPVGGTDYINVYRREVSGTSCSDPVNIGEIKPAGVGQRLLLAVGKYIKSCGIRRSRFVRLFGIVETSVKSRRILRALFQQQRSYRF